MVDKPGLQEKLDEALSQQIKLQQHLIDAQKEVIELQKKLEEVKPKTPDDDVHWNVVSNGLTSEQVLAEGNPEQLKQLYNWTFSFGEKYVKPYVHQKTYAEIMAHMTRSLARRMAEAEVKAEFGNVLPDGQTVQFPEKSEAESKASLKTNATSKKSNKTSTAKKKKEESSQK